MSDVVRVVHREVVRDRDLSEAGALLPLPLPEDLAVGPVRVRVGTAEDIAFMDALQKANSKALGFMFTATLKGHLEKGHVLVAEQMNREPTTVNCGEVAAPSVYCSVSTFDSHRPVGYLIAVDRYLKRDELGVIYQMCVVPEVRRSLVAATLLQAQFDRSAYGCRLYCCWCAQDLPANRFWESMGFVPLAFRTGGGRRKKDGPRMHIFWQKRIREGDTGDPASGGTPYWFPSLTGGGAIAEDRIVLPIPPGTHWSDAKPVVLPEGPQSGNDAEQLKLLESEVQRLEREKKQAKRKKARGKDRGSKVEAKVNRAAGPQPVTTGSLHFGPTKTPLTPEGGRDEEATKADAAAEGTTADLKKAKQALRKAKKKFDPAQVAFARELKDRWLEQVQQQPHLIAASAEKYAVRRCIDTSVHQNPQTMEIRRLDAA